MNCMQKSCFIMIKVMFYHQQKREFRISNFELKYTKYRINKAQKNLKGTQMSCEVNIRLTFVTFLTR